MVGFGFTDRPAHQAYTLDNWVAHAIGLLDALALPQVDLVGNSFGGALSLALAIRHPQRVRRLVLMGAAGVDFELTPALDAVWGYTPGIENMKSIMGLYDASLGARSNETSGRAILARERQGDVATFMYHDNLNASIQELLELLRTLDAA